MLDRRQLLGVVGVLGGVGLLGWALFGRASDEELIAEKLHHLAHVLGVDGDENPVFRLSRLQKEFKDLFTPDVRVSVPELTSLDQGRGELARVAAQAGARFRSAEISLSDLDIGVTGEIARVRARATLTALQGGRPRRDERHVDFTLSKVDGDWLIDSITVSSARS